MDLTLPALPEGYFWRLRSDSLGYMMVELRKKNKRWGSRLIEDGIVQANPPVPNAIMRAAEWALKKFNAHQDTSAFMAEFRMYEGDYK